MKRNLLMPAEAVKHSAGAEVKKLKKGLKALIGR